MPSCFGYLANHPGRVIGAVLGRESLGGDTQKGGRLT